MAAAASASMAASAVLMHRLTSAKHAVVFSPLPNRPSLSSIPSKQLKVTGRSYQLVVKASSPDETPLDANELLKDLQEKWDAVENKSTVLLYGGGAIVTVWLASIVVGAINSIPLLPKIMELVGIGYTSWFVYRYLLFKSSRKELATNIEAIKKKIADTE